MSARPRRCALPLILGFALAPVLAPSLPAQADTVVLKSGSPLVGEVKRLRQGSLSFDTREMDVVSIEWNEIARLASSRFYEVETLRGEEYFGTLSTGANGNLVVSGPLRVDTLPFVDVVMIRPFDRGFWARTHGFIDAGTNIARANRLRSMLIKGQFVYRGPLWGFQLGGDFYRQQQQTTDTAGLTTAQSTRRTSASARGDRFLGTRWSVSAAGLVEENEELNLDLRLLGLLGATYQFFRNHGSELYLGTGVSINDEKFSSEPRNTVAELLVAAGFDAFDLGDLTVNTTLSTYSSPADGGRIRVEFDGRAAWDFLGDFSLGLSITERFDSRPPSSEAAKRDFQYSFTLGWSWG